jgi:ATP-dependent DNA helicase RecG
MKNAHLVMPTFDSDRKNNQFTSRLLLHHFLDEKDLEWLALFSRFGLSDAQKQALVFVREVGAIDNQTYRQMADCDVTQASRELRQMKHHGLMDAKGKGKGTYYVPGPLLSTPPPDLSTPPLSLSTPPPGPSVPLTITEELRLRLNDLKKREHDSDKVRRIISEVCGQRAVKATEIAEIFGKGEAYMKRKYLSDMVKKGELVYLFPEMTIIPNRPI